MKIKQLFLLSLFLFSLCSCENEETVHVEENALSAVVLPVSFSAQEPREIVVQITTATPCYSIEVVKTVSGYTFEYNFVLTEEDNACIQVVKEHNIPVVFDPTGAGTYTLRFLIDGELQETREIVVAEYSLIGKWQVLRFEDEEQNTTISSPEGEEISITFGASGFEGTTDRNEFHGDYHIEANKILVTQFLSTEQEETEFGKRFYVALAIMQMQPMPFIAQENLLKIYYEEGQIMVLSRL